MTGRRREGRGGLSGNVAEEAFGLKSAPGLQKPSGPALARYGHLKNDSSHYSSSIKLNPTPTK